MRKKVIVLYDDRIRPNEKIAQISGNKSYGNIIFKQRTIQSRIEEIVLSKPYVQGFYSFSDREGQEKCLRELFSSEYRAAVLYFYSCFGIGDRKSFELLLDKAQFLNQPVRVTQKRKTAAFLFPGMEEFQKWVRKGSNPNSGEDMEELPGDMLVDFSSFEEFIRYMTNGFEARFFNSLEGDEYTVTKRSTNKEKIKKEYRFYYFLPDRMQHWFVQPFSYQETEDSASYTMERMHMTDLAIQYVHGAVSLEDFDQILQQLFYFLKNRYTRKIPEEEYRRQSEKLYLDKVMERYLDLKKSPFYTKMDAMIRVGTEYDSLDAVYERYRALYEEIHRKYRFEPLSTVSHGDLCFSNLLYQKHANILRMIDPKGAETEEDIWMDPWYDLAKLSHSVCGRYDFFNSGLYQIHVGKDMKLELQIDFQNQDYVALFRSYLEKNQFSYSIVRLYEASLFLSILPLHLDNPQKVFGFLLNGIGILKEVEECLKE